MRILISYKEKIALKRSLKKKGHGDLLMPMRYWYTLERQVSPRPGREHLHLSSRSIKLPVFIGEIQSECF